MSTREADDLVRANMGPRLRLFTGMVAAHLDARRLDGLADMSLVNGEVLATDRNARTATIVLRGAPSGVARWDLGRFEKNPVVVFGLSDAELPIAKAEETTLVEGGTALRMRLRFAQHAFAEQVLTSAVEGTIGGVVGAVTRSDDGAARLVAVSVQPLKLDDEDTQPATKEETMTTKNDAKTNDERLDAIEREIVDAKISKDRRIADAWRNPPQPSDAERTDVVDGTADVVDVQARLQAARANAWRGGQGGGDAA